MSKTRDTGFELKSVTTDRDKEDKSVTEFCKQIRDLTAEIEKIYRYSKNPNAPSLPAPGFFGFIGLSSMAEGKDVLAHNFKRIADLLDEKNKFKKAADAYDDYAQEIGPTANEEEKIETEIATLGKQFRELFIIFNLAGSGEFKHVKPSMYASAIDSSAKQKLVQIQAMIQTYVEKYGPDKPVYRSPAMTKSSGQEDSG